MGASKKMAEEFWKSAQQREEYGYYEESERPWYTFIIQQTQEDKADFKLKQDKHYDNSKGSIYEFCENQKLNAYEFDIIKRITRCRKKGNFVEDLQKTKRVIDLYLEEYNLEGK